MILRASGTEETMALLDGKVGIITGAASGIGAATARVLAREGARLVLTDLDDIAGAALAEEVGGVYLHHDVTEEDGWPAVIAAAGRITRLTQ
jgi:NAD(P)-dependent dehydrogenase (short-subunit alcohol dehydrogenase family)